MTVLAWSMNETNGNIIGELLWEPAAGATFRLEMAKDGRLVEWSARADAGCSLSARQLRAAPIGGMERAVRQEIASWRDVLHGQLRDGARRGEFVDGRLVVREATGAEMTDRWGDVVAWLSDFSDRPRTGPTGRSDRSYAALAKAYIETLDTGESTPVRALAEQLGLGEKTVRNHLFKARERGLLTSLGRGRAGGALTPKAKEILSGDDQTP